MFVRARSIHSIDEGLLERQCQLSDNDTEKLQSMWSNMTDRTRLILNRHRRSADEIAAWCPYTINDISLGPNIFPPALPNVTCGTPDSSQEGMCGSTPFPGADPSTCEPIYFNPKVLRLKTTKLQTSQCVIEAYEVSTIRLVIGCSCRA